MQDENKQLYASYNGMSRNPTIWGVPYMAGLFLLCITILPTTGLMIFTKGTLFVYPLVFGVAMFFFVKDICENDNRAIEVFLLELKWYFLKLFKGNTKRNGGTLTIAPITYGRVSLKNAKHYFKKSDSR